MDSMDLSRPVLLSYVIVRQFPVRAAFNPDELQSLDTEQKKPTLLNLVQQWLERTPGLEEDEFNFPFQYRKAVDKYLQARKDSIEVYRKMCTMYTKYVSLLYRDNLKGIVTKKQNY